MGNESGVALPPGRQRLALWQFVSILAQVICIISLDFKFLHVYNCPNLVKNHLKLINFIIQKVRKQSKQNKTPKLQPTDFYLSKLVIMAKTLESSLS